MMNNPKTYLDLEVIYKFSEKCDICKNVLNDDNGIHKFRNNYICNDCYYKECGKTIEPDIKRGKINE